MKNYDLTNYMLSEVRKTENKANSNAKAFEGMDDFMKELLAFSKEVEDHAKSKKEQD